jgi:hypothetical protein
MTDIVERLRERLLAPDADHILDEAADEIERLRADLLKAEMNAEINDLAEVGRLVAIGRREGIEAAAKVAERAHMMPPDGGSPTDAEYEIAKTAAQRIRALLTEGER